MYNENWELKWFSEIIKNHFDSKFMQMNWFKIKNKIIDSAKFNADIVFVMQLLYVALQSALKLYWLKFWNFDVSEFYRWWDSAENDKR